MRIRLWAAIFLAGALSAGTAHAEYPDHAIRYLLHVSPGGATDVMARKLASVLQTELKVPIVVENRPGGRGASQMAELTRAAPDGYTIGAVTSTHLSEFHQTLRRYNVSSVTWVARLVSEPYLFVVPNDSPVKSMKDLAAAIKANPGTMVAAGFVRGSGANIAWEMFLQTARLKSDDVNWVPYDSVGAGVTAVLGGHGTVTVAYYGLVKDQVTAGHLRIIGIIAEKRLADLPNVPTVEEQGFAVPDDWNQWRGIIAPKNLPKAVVDKLDATIGHALHSLDFQQYLKVDSLVDDYADKAAFTQFANSEDKQTLEWLKKLGFMK